MENRKKKIVVGIIGFLFVILGAGFFIQNSGNNFLKNIIPKNSFLSKVLPKVESAGAGFFDFSRKKIPVNAEYIDFTFSKDLDEDTINDKIFSVSPKIKGEVSLINGNIIRFKLEEKIKKEDYVFVLENAKTKKGEKIESTTFEVETVSEAKVLKITPTGNLDNLDQNFAVFFNVPMVPFTDLDSRDKLPCPISFKPEVKGKCSWTTTSVLEFIPEKRLFGSTKYEITVENKKGLLYPLGKAKIKELYTPRLDFYFSNRFSVSDGINFRSNFPVALDEIKKKLVLSKSVCKIKHGKISDELISGEKKIARKIINIEKGCKEEAKILDITISKDKNSFNIKLKKGSFDYNSDYYIEFSESINSINGNIPFRIAKKGDKGYFKEYIKSYGFLKGVQVYKNIYSKTGALVDTSFLYIDNNYENNKYIPIKNLFFNLDFEEEVKLDKKNFSFTTDNGKNIDFKIEYIKEENINNKNISKDVAMQHLYKVNKKRVKLTLKQKLENNKIYSLVISKNINKYLKEDIIKKFYSSKKLEVIDFRVISYGKTCLYLSNDIEYYWKNQNKIFESIPKSKKIHISTYDNIAYNLNKEAKKIVDYRERKEFLLKKGYCTPAKNGEHLYVLNTKLNPNSKYKLIIKKDFEDEYGNKLEKSYSKSIKTGDINDKDKYLYSSVSKEKNVIPANLPILINNKTINLDKIHLDVCQLSGEGYMNYLERGYEKGFVPKCIKQKKGNIEVKNNYWYLTNNVIDLEADFLKEKFVSNYILVKGKKNKNDKYFEFSNTYLRESLSIAYEVGNNKKLFFVTDFKGNQVTDVDFKFYKYDYKNKFIRGVDLKPILNKKTKVFELDVEKKLFDYVVVKKKNSLSTEGFSPLNRNSKSIGFLHLGSDYLSNYSFNYISGSSSSQKKFLYLYTERPIYKPGDTVFVKGLLREFKATGYSKTDIKKAKLELVGPSGEILFTNEIIVDKNSNFNTKFIIPKEVSLGQFKFNFNEIKGKNNYFVANNAYFDIQEYRKPTFKVNVENKVKNLVLGDKVKLTVKPEYYFGGKILNTAGNYNVLTQNYFFDAKDYSDYQFGEGYAYFDCIYWGSCNYTDNLEKSGEFNINENGEYKFELNLAGKEIKGEKLYSFNFEVTDPDTQRTVSKRVSKVLHNTDAYVGIISDYYNSKSSGINLKGVVLDFETKPIEGKNVKVELIKIDWKSVKKKGVDGIFYNDYSLDEKVENTFNLKSDKKGEFTKNILTKKIGEYKIKVSYTGANKKSFISSKEVYIAGNDYVEWHNDNNDVTEFVAEKVQVKIGEKAEYMLKTPINSGKALIIIEKDNDILDYFVHDIKSFSDKITIDVKDTYYPNYYIKAFLIGEQKNNPLPVYKRALVVTKVNTEYKKLNIAIKTNKKNYLPGAEVALEIKVTDINGKAVANADLSVSLVDESLLALKGNPKKNPYAFFYDLKRYLGITTYSSLKNLIEKLEVKGTTNGEKGGAGDQIKGGSSKKKRGIFKDTAFWQASLVTGKNGIAKIKSSKLPDNLTTWVIEVLANTASDTKVGVNYETITTSKKLLINDNLPRFFGSNDEIILSPVVFNKTGKTDTFNVSLNISNAKIIGEKIQKIKIKDGESKTVNFKIKVSDIGISENKNLFTSKINFKAISSNKNDIDEIEKFVKVREVSTAEFVSTFGKTNKTSFEEKINIGKIKNSAGKLTINYSATLLTSILDGIEYLNKYPYGCSEQKTSAIMPNIFIKQLYNSVGKDFDLKKKMIKYWISDIKGYGEKSLDQIIKEYLVNIKKYQKRDGGFVYFYDVVYGPNYSNFRLTSYILESGAEIKKVGFTLNKSTYDEAVKYLKNRFYKNNREGCERHYNINGIRKIRDCRYSETSRLKAISAILSYNENDYEAYKMYKILDFSKINNSLNLEKVKLIAKLTKIKDISDLEKENLRKEAKQIVDKIINEELVFNPRGAYLGKTGYYSRFRNTVSLLETISIIGLDKFEDIEKIIDNINRWLIGQKDKGSFGSTSDNIALIKAITKYLESSGELKDVDNFTKIKLNNETVAQTEFNDKNKLEVFSKIVKLDSIKNNNSFVVEKGGKGTIYYDLNLSYYKDARNIKARDEGFFVETNYYKYADYKKIESLKEQEWKKYNDDKISYDDLKYSKNIFAYLKVVKSGKVGQLLIVKNKIITTETRDKVAFEGFIPAGAELINPNLATSSKANISSSKDVALLHLYFSKKEYRFDRIFGYKDTLYPGIYNFTYLIRLTHSGEYSIKPTRISEFYNVEVFGRNKGRVFKIEK